jgi:type III pantothenate kinase
MIALIDIGNSRTKVGIVKESNIDKSFSINTSESYNKLLFELGVPDKIFFSSVVPSKSEELMRFFESKKIYEVNINPNLGIDILYKTPQTLGIDRVCGILGAKKLAQLNSHKSDLIITIDCGTATTINVLYQNSFIGGLIAPGISTMFSSLNKNTSLLPELNFDSYTEFIGNSTETSIVSGVVNATLGFISHSINKIEKLYETNASIFITGGNSKKLLPYLDKNIMYEKDLVLIGILSVAEKMG